MHTHRFIDAHTNSYTPTHKHKLVHTNTHTHTHTHECYIGGRYGRFTGYVLHFRCPSFLCNTNTVRKVVRYLEVNNGHKSLKQSERWLTSLIWTICPCPMIRTCTGTIALQHTPHTTQAHNNNCYYHYCEANLDKNSSWTMHCHYAVCVCLCVCVCIREGWGLTYSSRASYRRGWPAANHCGQSRATPLPACSVSNIKGEIVYSWSKGDIDCTVWAWKERE